MMTLKEENLLNLYIPYLLIDRVYKDNKALAKDRGFHAVVPTKKNRKSTWLYDKQLYKQQNIIERYFLCCKTF